MTPYFFISKNNRFYARLALLASILAFIVVSLGAFTRITNAGLSCPDWPVCYGYITAPHTATQVQQAALQYPSTPVNTNKAWTEMVHRYLAGTLSLLVFILVITTGRLQKKIQINFNPVRIALLMLLASQVLLGMLTVTLKLSPGIVLGHLVTGFALLSLLWWSYLKFSNQPTPLPYTSHAKHWIHLGLLILVLQIILGGWVSTHYAGLACIHFPYCNGPEMPTLHFNQLNTDLVTIHMLHRFGAMLAGTYLGLLAIILLFTNKELRFFASILLILLLGQISLGILNIVWLRPTWIALFHNMTAALLLLTLITLLVKTKRASAELAI